jgi:hypothetical protein
MGRAVREILELEIEFAAPQGDDGGSYGFSRRLIAIVLGVFGGVCCALFLSILLSHAVGAATPALSVPGPSVGPAAQGILTATQSTISAVSTPIAPAIDIAAPVADAASAAATPLVSALGGSTASLDIKPVQTLRQTVIPVVSPAVTSVTAVVPPVVAALPPVLGQVVHTGLPLVLPGQPSTATPSRAVAITTPATTSASAMNSLASSVIPNAPVRVPSPFAPTPQAPVAPSSAVADGSSPFSGSNPLLGHRPLDLLLPAILSIGLVLWLTRESGVLLDLRHSPPG